MTETAARIVTKEVAIKIACLRSNIYFLRSNLITFIYRLELLSLTNLYLFDCRRSILSTATKEPPESCSKCP